MSAVYLSSLDGLTLLPEESFSDALNLINNNGLTACLICSTDKSFNGMVTDSDIRKSLLRGVSLSDPISLVMNRTPLIVSPDTSEIEIARVMQTHNYQHVPVVSSDNILVGLYVSSSLLSPPSYDEPIIMMAGGKGKRLRPLTASCPKPMLPISGKPILHHLIDRVSHDGFSNIVLSVGYLADQIKNYFGDGSSFGVSITYLTENSPLGTAGAIADLPSPLCNGYVLVINADLVTQVSLSDMLNYAKYNHLDGLMAVRNYETQVPFGVVHTDSMSLISLEEKPIYRDQVNAGIYVLGPRMLRLLRSNEYCDMTDLFSRSISSALNLHVYPLHESWLDIGRPDDYASVSSH